MNNKAASLTPEQALAELEARYEASVTALRKAIGDYIDHNTLPDTAARAGHVRKRGQPCGRQRNVGSPRGPHLMVSTPMVYGCAIDVFN